jgi:anaerobic magnesium-protoporphyrin IX monomethyl ester cyclase
VNKGYYVTYIVYADLLDRERITKAAKEADIAGIMAVTPTISIAAKVAKSLKKINPNIITVVGGPHATALPKETLVEFSGFDYAVSGSGEEVFLELINKIGGRIDIGNIAFRDNQKNIKYNKETRYKKASKLIPAYDLLYRSMNEYAHNIRTQEGCSYNCDFCAEKSIIRESHAQESLYIIIEELSYLHSHCTPKTLVHFSDSVFNADENHASSVCERIAEFSDKFIYSIDTRAELATTKFVRKAAKAGIKYFRIGATSLQESLLKGSNGNNIVIDASKQIKSASAESIIHLYWMTGLPGSNLENLGISALAIKNLIKKNYVHIVGNRIFVPYPGTNIFINPTKYGIKILKKNWDYYDRLSPPVYSLDSIMDFEIYDQFLKTEKLQVEAYKERYGKLKRSNCGQLDYVYFNYIIKKERKGF